MLEVREFNDVTKLADLREAWNVLLAETEGADYFRTLDWLEVYWRHYGAGRKLRVLAIAEGDEVTGIFPLVVARRQTRAGGLRVLEFPLDFWGSFYGPIGPHPEQTFAAGLKHIFDSRRDWDYIDLRWLPVSEYGAGALAEAAKQQRVSMLPRADDEIALVDIRGGWDDYWASRSGNWRSNCRRNAKKTAANGDVEFVRYRP